MNDLQAWYSENDIWAPDGDRTRNLTGHQKVVGSIPVWGSDIIFWVSFIYLNISKLSCFSNIKLETNWLNFFRLRISHAWLFGLDAEDIGDINSPDLCLLGIMTLFSSREWISVSQGAIWSLPIELWGCDIWAGRVISIGNYTALHWLKDFWVRSAHLL